MLLAWRLGIWEADLKKSLVQKMVVNNPVCCRAIHESSPLALSPASANRNTVSRSEKGAECKSARS